MENNELVVSQPYSQGETFPIAFNILKMTATLGKLMHLNAVEVFTLEMTRSVINSGLSFYVSRAILQTLIIKLSDFFRRKEPRWNSIANLRVRISLNRDFKIA